MSSSRDGHVHVLPLHIANKIAAGEVVERPASVVKELVENSIDAGARLIRIAIVQGGRKLIAVQDDGCGMERADALLALERQATSKILDVSDIENIDTLGFRGEAIPSIASVSVFSLTTRRHDSDEGVFIQVNAGTVAEVRAAGCPAGTRVEVRDLFCNVPARRKFLRACATEESHIKQIFTAHALAHPAIAFSLSVDGREVCNLPPAESAKDRIREVFSAELAESLVPISHEEGGISVNGFIERPNLNTPTRKDQYIFINGRPASAPAIAYALKEAYPRRQGDAKPGAFIFIDAPPGAVDVNVHPTKREVRFRNNSAVKCALMAAISGALFPAGPKAPSSQLPPDGNMPTSGLAATAANPEPAATTSATPAASNPSASAPCAIPAPAPEQLELPMQPPPPASSVPWSSYRFLACTDSGYLIIETESGIVTINPAAANERIAFERLQRRDFPSQELLFPETVKLSPAEFARIKPAIGELEKTGFALEEFGRDTFKVDAVPAFAGGISIADALSTLAQDLAESRRGGEKWLKDAIARSLAKTYAKRPRRLDETLANALVRDLSACRMPYVAPDGRKIMIFTSNRELERKFSS